MPKFNPEKLNKLKKIDRLFKSVYLFPKNRKKNPPVAKKDVKEILVLGFFLIGDTIMFLPALRLLKKNFPHASITLVCPKPVWVILQGQEVINEFIVVNCPWLPPNTYSYKSIKQLYSAIRLVNKKRYDLAIDFRGDWRGILFMNYIKAARKVSYNSSGGEYMLTDPVTPNEHLKHVTDESLYLLQSIGCFYDEDEHKRPVLILTDTDKAFVNEFKKAKKLEDKFVIGVHPGASQEVKRWDEKKYSELIVRLSAGYSNSTFIIFEGPNEHDVVAKIEAILKENNIIDYTVVSLSLHEYILAISTCQLMICNDSGAAHIAAAFGIALIVIFGNVNPDFVSPYGSELKKVISHQLECKPCNQSYCKFGTNLCIAGITVEEVYKQAVDIINSLKTQNRKIEIF